MFTGIIFSLGTVVRREGLRLWVRGALPRARRGDSVAVNGVCLTIVGAAGPAGRRTLRFDLSEETLQRTSIGSWAPGRRVNLEPALRMGDPLGGHIVQGHVDAVGKILAVRPEKDWRLFTFSIPASLRDFLVTKGSVAVDGISLTVVNPRRDRFDVAVIPHTDRVTTLGAARVGDPVNLEADPLAKHVAQLVAAWRTK
jgi:riboflavin synthase